MFCLKCGKEVSDGAKFCPHCGTETAVPVAGTAAPQPPSGGSKRRAGLLIAVAVVLTLMVAGAAAFASGLFASPKDTVEKAITKSVSAYAEAKNALGAPNLETITQNRAYSQRASFVLNSIDQELTAGGYDLSPFKGLGVRVENNYDQKARKMDVGIGAFWDGEDLASIQLLVDGGKATFSSPEFTKGEAYGIDTETIGADLVRLGAEDGEINIGKIGFNFFDLVDKATPSEEKAKEVEAAMADACKQLFDAIEAEKDGKQSVQVNGKNLDATRYHVAIPKDAVMDFINAWENSTKLVDSKAVMEDVLLSMGFDQATVNEILSNMDTAGMYSDMASTLKQAAKSLGDVELEVYVSGGYVCAVEYSGLIEDSEVSVALQLGGGDSYVDDLSLEIAVDGEKLTVESSGDHGAKRGVFTDETTVRSGSDRITSALRWEPKATSGNFAWELTLSGSDSLTMEGQLTTTKDSIDLKLDDLSMKAMGAKLLSLEVDYYLGPCGGVKVSHPSPKLLSDMDEDNLEDLLYELGENAEAWAYDVMEKIPQDALDVLMG